MIKTCSQCKKQFELKQSVKRRLMQKYIFCSQKCARKHIGNRFKGENNPSWKGGRQISKDNYILVYCPGHPKADNNRVREHRLVMEKHIGRYLKTNEHVHHINENKQDNRIKNLMIIKHKDHMSIHHRGKKLSIKQRKALSLFAKKRWIEDGGFYKRA